MTNKPLSEELFQYIWDNIRDIIFTLDGEGFITSISREFETITGGSREKWIGKHFLDLVHPEDSEIVKEGFNATIRGEIPPPYSARVPTKNGSLVILESKATPQISQGKIIGYLGIARDVTERIEMEKKLKASEEQYRTAINSIGDPIHVINQEHEIILTNHAFYPWLRRLKLNPVIIGKKVTEAFPFLPKQVEIEYQSVFKRGDLLVTEEQTEIKGLIYYTETKKIPIFDKDQKEVIQVLTIIRDITERKIMEEELRESEEKFRSIFENAPIGMLLTNLNYQFSKVNAVFCNMLGYSEQELTQLTFSEITHPEHAKRDVKFTEQLIEGKNSIYQTEKRYLKKNSDFFWAQTTVTLLKNEKDEPSFFLAMIEDISVLKEKEEELKSQLLKFKVEDGKMYLIKEKVPRLSQTVFEDLTKVGYNGFIVSRTPKKNFNNHIKEKIAFFQLTEKNNFETLLNVMKETPRKSVFLFDRLEYLFLKEGFEIVTKFIFKLNEMVYFNNLVVLLSVDTSTLTEREIAVIEKETHALEPRFIATFSEEFLQILKYVFQQNGVGVKPSYSDIGEELKISRPTARKRIKHLVSRGYLVEHQTGKSKFLELSGKGEILFLT